MDVDDNPTPRSGRKKKSSALSRLAAQKGKSITPQQSFNSGGGDTAPKYLFDANVEIQHGEERRSNYEEDSDEGIQNSGSTYNSSYGLNVKDLKLDSSHSSTLKNFKHLKMDTVVSDDETGEKNYHSIKIKGEKRFRDANSSGEELAVDTGRAKGKKHPHSASDTMSMEEKSSGERKVDRKDYSHSETRDPYGEIPRHQMEIDDEDLTDSRSFNVSRDASGRTKIGERDQSAHIKTSSQFDFYSKNSKQRESDQELIRSNNCRDDDMDKTFTLKKGLSDSYDVNNQSLAERYRDSLADQESNNVNIHENNERYDNLGDLRPGPSASPPPTFNRNYSGSSLQASVLNSTDRPWSSMQRIPSGGTDVMSERSYQSTSALPPVSTKDVKERSFLVGSMNSRTSLLGSEELDRLFPDRKMKVFVCTWNMCEMKDLPENLDDFLLPDATDYIPDAYVVGTQESTNNRKEWEIRLQETLGPNHVLFHSASFGVLYLSIFLRRDLIWFCSVVEEGNISTRPGPSGMKTKGAVAVSFTFFGSSLLFVNAHLTPHDGKAKERAADYHKINRGLNLPKNVGNKSSPKKKNNVDGGVTSRFDCVFWSGDLNFRLEKERERLDRTIEGIEARELPDFTDLMVHDELFRIRNEELAFQDFQEGRIKFKPTYKYDIGTDKFDTSKKMRIPSYTDRILFRCKRKNSISCLHYGAVETLKESDHRPVFGVFEVELRPGRDNITLSGGQFERDIWLEGNRRRAERLDNKKRSQKQSTVCSIQ